jgi:hypothetical protein
VYLTKLHRGPRQRRALDDHIQSANDLIQEDRRIIASEVVQILGIRQTAETTEEDCGQKMFYCIMKIPPPPPSLNAAVATIQAIRNLKFDVLPHPPYNLDLAPCDFHAFGPLRVHRFGGEAVHTWIREQPKTCFSEVVRKTVDRYERHV